jgi:hypothetical protein
MAWLRVHAPAASMKAFWDFMNRHLMAVVVSFRIGAPPEFIASTRILQSRPAGEITGKAGRNVVVVLLPAAVNVRISEPIVIDPAQSA